jgi:hypothetical protein
MTGGAAEALARRERRSFNTELPKAQRRRAAGSTVRGRKLVTPLSGSSFEKKMTDEWF